MVEKVILIKDEIKSLKMLILDAMLTGGITPSIFNLSEFYKVDWDNVETIIKSLVGLKELTPEVLKVITLRKFVESTKKHRKRQVDKPLFACLGLAVYEENSVIKADLVDVGRISHPASVKFILPNAKTTLLKNLRITMHSFDDQYALTRLPLMIIKDGKLKYRRYESHGGATYDGGRTLTLPLTSFRRMA